MTPVATRARPQVGALLRDWRRRRGRSQLELASAAEVSARHLSFVETGRSRPSRELVLHLAEHLDVPLRDRNVLLLAAGYAPTYRETRLDDPAMAPVRAAVGQVLSGHEPFPALAVDRRWNVVAANRPATALLTVGVAPALLGPPPNALRVSLHPDGLAPRIVNLEEWSAHLLERLARQAAASGDVELLALRDELRSYPGVREASPTGDGPAVVVPLVLRVDGHRELRFFSTVATFGTPLDITVAELAIESFFPADDATATAIRALPGGGTAPS